MSGRLYCGATALAAITGLQPPAGFCQTSRQTGRPWANEAARRAILRRLPDGSFETLVHDPRLLWPDTMSLSDDGYLYVTANQLFNQPSMHDGKDLRQKPYVLFRIKVDAKPIRLQ